MGVLQLCTVLTEKYVNHQDWGIKAVQAYGAASHTSAVVRPKVLHGMARFGRAWTCWPSSPSTDGAS